MSVFAPATMAVRGIVEPVTTVHHNAATANGTGTNVLLSGKYATLMLMVSGGGVAMAVPEVSVDGSNWARAIATSMRYSLRTTEIDTSLSESYMVPVAGALYFRVTITGYVSGSITIKSYVSQQTPLLPDVTWQDTLHHNATAAVSGGSVANLFGQYASATIYITGTGVATLTPQISYDAANWYAIQSYRHDTGQAVYNFDATPSRVYRCNVAGAKFFRVVVSPYTSGAITVRSLFTDVPITAFDTVVQQAIQAAAEAVQAAVEDTDTGYSVLGAHTTVATLSTAQTITPAAGARELIMQAFGQPVRYTLDGTTPTASTGFQIAADERVTVPVAASGVVKVIETAASATLQYQAVG